MSGGVSNLGMGAFSPLQQYNLRQAIPDLLAANPLTSGVPVSASQLQEQFGQWRGDYQRQMGALNSARAAAADASLANVAQQGGASPSAEYVSQLQGLDPAFQSYFDAQNSAFQNAYEQKRQAEAVQQQAYNQQTGAGFTGGLLNDTYGNAFAGTITGAPGFQSGMMGQGASSAVTASTGLNPWMPGQTGAPGTPPQAPMQAPNNGNASGWGGPFSAKNPWSLG